MPADHRTFQILRQVHMPAGRRARPVARQPDKLDLRGNLKRSHKVGQKDKGALQDTD